MWVFCCGMYRSASTLQFQITSRLVKDAEIGEQIGWIDVKRFSQVKAAYADRTALKVIKVHDCTDEVTTEFQQGQAIGIYTFRDLRDVYISYMKQRMKPFDLIWQENFIESCLDNYRKWTSLPNVLISRYEQIIDDLPGEVQRIARHLGISVNSEQCETIAADYSINLQQERIQQFQEKLLQMEHNSEDHRETVDYHDENTLLHLNHITSAQVGRWRDDLSQPQVEQIVERVEHWCRSHDYQPSTFLR